MLVTRRLFCWKWCFSVRRLTLTHPVDNVSSTKFLNHNHIRFFSILKQSFITDLSLDIDINGLKEKQKQQLKLGKKVNVHKLVNDELEQRCSKVIQDFTADKLRMLKVIQLEHSIFYAEGYNITPPEEMNNKTWIEAMTHPSKEERLGYYLFIKHTANLRGKKLIEQEEDKLLHGNLDGETDKSIIFYEDVTSTTRWGNYGLASAMMHGVPLVFDMEFDDSMTPKEVGDAARQLWLAYCANRAHPDPFHFIFTGCQRTNSLYRTLELQHALKSHHFLVSQTERCYLDLFDSSKLVYLSPRAKQVLRNFDPTNVYIIGAYADHKNAKKFGTAKAKEQNIQCLKLPIDENVKWVQGTKDLVLQSVVQLLLSVKGGETWRDAFGSVLHSKNFRHYGE